MLQALVSFKANFQGPAPGSVRLWLAATIVAAAVCAPATGQSCGLHATVDHGNNVAIGQDIMVVRVQETSESTPSIEVRRFVKGDWSLIQTLTPVAGNNNTWWGSALATDGQTIVIGDREANWPGFSRNGIVAVYTRHGNSFALEVHLTPPLSCSFLMFGGAVAVDKETIVVTRWTNTTTCGGPGPDREAYVFRRVSSGWTYAQSLVPPQVQPPPGFFGVSVVVACDNVLIGSYGRVFKYHFDVTSWIYDGSFKPGGSGDTCGSVMSGAGPTPGGHVRDRSQVAENPIHQKTNAKLDDSDAETLSCSCHARCRPT